MPKMNVRIITAVIAAVFSVSLAHAQQSQWASADDKNAQHIIEMERKWAEGACVNNGVVAGLLAADFEGTSTSGVHFLKGDELKDEKGAHTAHDCGLDENQSAFLRREYCRCLW